jgi:hypothetical protein
MSHTARCTCVSLCLLCWTSGQQQVCIFLHPTPQTMPEPSSVLCIHDGLSSSLYSSPHTMSVTQPGTVSSLTLEALFFF